MVKRRRVLAVLEGLTAEAILPLRRFAGPFHRGQRALPEDRNTRLPPLPAPWTDDRWFRGSFPPRAHNTVEPLIDGAAYFADLHRALLGAQRRVTIAGWCLTPLMPLLRGEGQAGSELAEILRQVSERADVYVLLWSGAPVFFQPTERMVDEAIHTLTEIAPRVRCVADRRAVFSHDHHQKAVTIDGTIAYVGGIDICTFHGDRWDTHGHPLRYGPNWHDVQARLQGEVVRDVEANFCERWNAVTGEHLEPLSTDAPLDPAWNTPVQIVRTVPAGFYPFAPEGEYGIYHAILTGIRRAERFIYLENQYLWSPEVVDALEEAIRRRHDASFRVVLVLPARATYGRYDNDAHVRTLRDVDGGRGILHVYSLYTGGPATGATGYAYSPVYVHAKVSIVDDEWFSIGSANLNQRGLALDTEMNVHGVAPDVARDLRVRLWAGHLAVDPQDIADRDPIEVIDTLWRERAAGMEGSITTGGPRSPGQVRTYHPDASLVSRALDFIQDVSLEH